MRCDERFALESRQANCPFNLAQTKRTETVLTELKWEEEEDIYLAQTVYRNIQLYKWQNNRTANIFELHCRE